MSGQLSSGRLENVVQPEIKVWVDKRSFLPLRVELRDASGAVQDRSEVSRVEYDIAIPDSTFSYTPPAGVTVSTFHGGDGAAVKRALSGTAETKPPAKTKP